MRTKCFTIFVHIALKLQSKVFDRLGLLEMVARFASA